MAGAVPPLSLARERIASLGLGARVWAAACAARRKDRCHVFCSSLVLRRPLPSPSLHFLLWFFRWDRFKLGTRPEKLRIQKWYTVYKDHITLEDYEIHDGMGL